MWLRDCRFVVVVIIIINIIVVVVVVVVSSLGLLIKCVKNNCLPCSRDISKINRQYSIVSYSIAERWLAPTSGISRGLDRRCVCLCALWVRESIWAFRLAPLALG